MGTHGALPEERQRAQPFEVDLDVEADLAAAGSSDDLDDTLDYGAIATAARQVIEGTSVRLLERLAERIAEEVRAIPGVDRVTVTVRKMRPPVAADLRSAGVRVTRP